MRTLFPLGLLITASLVGCLSSGDHASQRHPSREVRTIRGIIKQEDLSPIPISLDVPMLLAVYAGDIYVGDQERLEIFRLAPDGTLKSIIGKGRGQGPGEMQQMIDLTFQDSKVWVVDLRAHLLHVFRPDGTFLYNITMPADILRLIAIDPTTLAAHVLMHRAPLITLDTLGQIRHRWGSELWEYTDNPLAITGDLLYTPEDHLLHFVPSYASYIFTYTRDGTLQKETVLIDEHPFPGQTKVRKGEDVLAIQPPQSPIFQFPVGVYEGKLFIVTQIRESQKTPTFRYLDVYSYPEMAYAYSYQLNMSIYDMVVYDSHTLLVTRDTALYEVKLPTPF